MKAAGSVLGCIVVLFGTIACIHTRTIKVTCGPTDAELVSADFGSPNVAGISIGLLNTHQFSPGMLLELVPPTGADRFGSGSIPYTLQVTDGDFTPAQPEATVSKVVSANFVVEMDADVKKAVEVAKVDLKNSITNNTKLTVSNAQRHTLRDPIGLLNADPKAIERINHSGQRYALISAVSHGTGVGLSYESTASASAEANVIRVGNFKLKITFACSDIAAINGKGEGKDTAKASVLFFYVPVVVRDGRVDTDIRALDLTKYRLVPASPEHP